MDDRILQQPPIPIDDIHRLKSYAKSHGMKVYELIDEILEWFFTHYNKQRLLLLSSPGGFGAKRSNKYWSIWIREDLHTRVQAMSKKQGTSQNRIIYTALKYYIEEKIP
ncbi:MAG: hypothetical protein ACJA04_000246 [Cellvibrionaceae bacterium]|jgi:hypothetical protein